MEKIIVVTGRELSGLQPKTHCEITRDFFNRLREENPKTTLDAAILKFENAFESYKTLEAFATVRCRTAESYRDVYMLYWGYD